MLSVMLLSIADDTSLYSKWDQASDLSEELKLASELESVWNRKWLVDFDAGKTQLVWYDRSNGIGAIDVLMDGFVLEEKSSF